MKKRKLRKLHLRRETLRDLSPSPLRQAAGGTAVGIGVAVETVIRFTIEVTRETVTPLTPNTCDASLCVTDPPTCTTCWCPSWDGNCEG